MRFSASKINTWMSCPLQARFKYVDKLPTKQSGKASFGTIIHDALDYYNNTRDVDGAVRRFTENWENPGNLGVEPEYWPRYTTYGGLRTRGQEIIREYADKLKWENREVIATEHKFLVPFGDHEIVGFVDLVELRTNSKGKQVLRIVDYKTNAKAPFTTALRVNIQFTAYIYASLQPEFWLGNPPEADAMEKGDHWFPLLEGMEREGIWYHLMTNKELSCGTRDDKDFMRLYRACEEIAKAEEQGIYVPNISGDTCTYCDFTEPCGVPIPPRN
jgi:CRISPR/Cas system-associated exonuclease Cas4 (RecB family)